MSRDSLMWAAEKRIPYIMLSTELEPTKAAFQLYHDRAAELGYESARRTWAICGRSTSTRPKNWPRKPAASSSKAPAIPS